jgi:hypothetical protein
MVPRRSPSRPPVQARERGSEVVTGIEQQRDLDRRIVAVARVKEVGGAQDEKRGSSVAGFECSHGGKQPSQASAQDGSDLEAERTVFVLLERWGMADGIDDRSGRQQAGDDGDEDRASEADQGKRAR